MRLRPPHAASAAKCPDPANSPVHSSGLPALNQAWAAPALARALGSLHGYSAIGSPEHNPVCKGDTRASMFRAFQTQRPHGRMAPQTPCNTSVSRHHACMFYMLELNWKQTATPCGELVGASAPGQATPCRQVIGPSACGWRRGTGCTGVCRPCRRSSGRPAHARPHQSPSPAVSPRSSGTSAVAPPRWPHQR